MSAWDASQSKLNEYYSMLWSQIQEMGTAMEDTVSGMNDALATVQDSATDDGSTDYSVDYLGQMKDVVGRLFDPYLKQFHLNMSDLQGSFTSMSKAGFITASSGIATLYGTDKVKDFLLGGEEEEDKSDNGGGDKEAADSGDSDEDDFWDLIEGLGDAASISDKRNYKIEDSDD